MARYLIDVNLPRYFSLWSTDDYIFVSDIDDQWKDQQIWEYALEHDLVIVTKDADFTDRVLVCEIAPRIIHIRFGNMKMRDFHTFMSKSWSYICALSQEHQMVQVYKDRVETIS